MPTIHHPQQPPEYDNSRRNEVVGVTEARTLAVAFVDGDGRKRMCLALVFGKDTEDGGPGVFILADENQMQEQLKLANSTVKKGVRKWISGQTETTSEDVPDSLGSVVDFPAGGTEESSDDPLSGILPTP